MAERAINRKWVIENLRETMEHIESAIQGLKQGSDHALDTWIPFIYLDLNRAWNGRHIHDIASVGGDNSLTQYPTDIDLSVPD